MVTNQQNKPDYGVDAPNVLRNLFIFGAICLIAGLLGPRQMHFGSVTFLPRPMFIGTGIVLLVEALLFLLYVKYGKFRHRDQMLALHTWRGDEQVLDVGCGRGLLLAGAAKKLAALDGSGKATGIDIWSTVDMGGNAEAATWQNLKLEGIADRCAIVETPAQDMPFADASFDLIVSNLCLHNICGRALRLQALQQIARVLKPGGQAILSDYKLTGEYAKQLGVAGLSVERRWGNPLYTFPPLRIVVARKS